MPTFAPVRRGVDKGSDLPLLVAGVRPCPSDPPSGRRGPRFKSGQPDSKVPVQGGCGGPPLGPRSNQLSAADVRGMWLPYVVALLSGTNTSNTFLENLWYLSPGGQLELPHQPRPGTALYRAESRYSPTRDRNRPRYHRATCLRRRQRSDGCRLSREGARGSPEPLSGAVAAGVARATRSGASDWGRTGRADRSTSETPVISEASSQARRRGFPHSPESLVEQSAAMSRISGRDISGPCNRPVRAVTGTGPPLAFVSGWLGHMALS